MLSNAIERIGADIARTSLGFASNEIAFSRLARYRARLFSALDLLVSTCEVTQYFDLLSFLLMYLISLYVGSKRN